ncbi:hypothetical protein B0H14DRAFT_3659912 [Mycena olivaceomarginata]|nr:hypothetical protein B0H14DRAFT_3659912 [Mycena olivaceomarginata]
MPKTATLRALLYYSIETRAQWVIRVLEGLVNDGMMDGSGLGIGTKDWKANLYMKICGLGKESLEDEQIQGRKPEAQISNPVNVLALLGDNPMQSEFACHIGLRGKLFCRACWVKGTDALDLKRSNVPDDGSVAGSDGGGAGSAGHGSDLSDVSDSSGTGSQKAKKGGKVKETLVQMVNRVKDFVKIGRLRTKSETTDKLKSFFTEASTVVGGGATGEEVRKVDVGWLSQKKEHCITVAKYSLNQGRSIISKGMERIV